MKNRNCLGLIIVLNCLACFAGAQDVILRDSAVTMAAGAQFKASPWKQLWWGKHYRKEWIAHVNFQVIDLAATAGGLKPTRLGGGHETKSLRLIGANGKEYVLRTMDKDLTPLVPEEFKQTFVNEILNDQVCTAHPYGPVIAASLSGYAGLNHTNPIIVFVPSSKILGEFDSLFSNRLCLFEERPSGQGWENSTLAGDADKIINTEKLLKNLKEDPFRKVDQKEFLKVRLFDIWINDWDRHEDQWLWAAHREGKKTIYKAFARDRDQSFSKTDGINLFLLSRPWAYRSLQDMDGKIRDVIGVTFNGRYLDKQFLNELSRQDWIDVIGELQSSLTDKAIESAVALIPDTLFKISGVELIKLLKLRRADMMRFGLRYYEIMSKEVDVTGSDRTDQFLITSSINGTTDIVVKSKHNDILFQRSFVPGETKNIYLYGLEGDDTFSTEKYIPGKINVTVAGNGGRDNYKSDSMSLKHNKVNVYEDPTNSVDIPSSYKAYFTNDTLQVNYNRKHYNYDWYAPLILPGYNPDDGVFIGAGFIYKKRGWGKLPFSWEQSFGGSVAFRTGATSFFYSGRFTKAVGPFDLKIQASYRGPQFVTNFYGYGNDTKLTTDDMSYNRVRVNQAVFKPTLIKEFGSFNVNFGLVAEYIKVRPVDGKFISDFPELVDSSVFESNKFIGGFVNYSMDKTNDSGFPTKGYSIHANAEYKQNLGTNDKSFLNLNGSVTIYIPLENFVLAHRSGAATNIGDYQFYHANYLGGTTNLRGYYRSRFAGKSSFYQNTEMRLVVATLHGYVLRGRLGLFGFFDDGRVWVENDNSNTIHTGYGGGVFFAPFNATTLRLSCGISEEKTTIQFGMNFFF